jgi:hypothetical protein
MNYMNNKLYFSFVVVIFLVFIIVLIYILHSYLRKSIIESFEDSTHECSRQFKKNSFCQYNYNDNKCECRYQKDEIKLSFFASPNCCTRECSKYSKEECLQNSKNKDIPYYCNIAGKCIENTGTIMSNHISANNCGTDPLNNQLLLPYTSEDECESSSDPCNKYNDPSMTQIENKEQCLKDVNCGYCTNSSGIGKCISGNASKPMDLRKYYYCVPNQKNTSKFSYEYGNHMEFLM